MIMLLKINYIYDIMKYHIYILQVWRNWQTRYFEGVVNILFVWVRVPSSAPFYVIFGVCCMEGNMSRKEAVFDYLDTAVKTVVIALLFFTFIFSPSTVQGESMFPTLKDKDRTVVYSLFYKPKVKDIVVITQPNIFNHVIVKRVIADEGQTVNIDPTTKEVFIDGKKIKEDYINEPMEVLKDVQFPVTVPKNCVFVMGDNRNHSTDSRSSLIGMIDKRYIKGKVAFRVFPLNSFGVVK